jgi:hypothetical protein
MKRRENGRDFAQLSGIARGEDDALHGRRYSASQ